jgi:hypothetical protein
LNLRRIDNKRCLDLRVVEIVSFSSSFMHVHLLHLFDTISCCIFVLTWQIEIAWFSLMKASNLRTLVRKHFQEILDKKKLNPMQQAPTSSIPAHMQIVSYGDRLSFLMDC